MVCDSVTRLLSCTYLRRLALGEMERDFYIIWRSQLNYRTTDDLIGSICDVHVCEYCGLLGYSTVSPFTECQYPSRYISFGTMRTQASSTELLSVREVVGVKSAAR